MIYFYYMYYQLNLISKIILIFGLCSMIILIIQMIRVSIFLIQCKKQDKKQGIQTSKKIRKEVKKYLEEIRLEKEKAIQNKKEEWRNKKVTVCVYYQSEYIIIKVKNNIINIIKTSINQIVAIIILFLFNLFLNINNNKIYTIKINAIIIIIWYFTFLLPFASSAPLRLCVENSE